MIYISRMPSGAVLLQKDAAEIAIDASAVPVTLGVIIAELIGCGKAVSEARRGGYEDGLVQGRINAAIEQATSERIAERQAADLVEALVGLHHANAA